LHFVFFQRVRDHVLKGEKKRRKKEKEKGNSERRR
jgi:hypothetical protein